MSLPKSSISGGISWFWGVVISIAFHGFIFLLILYWGFGKSHYSAQPNFIEGRLVSLSELSRITESRQPPSDVKEIQEAPEKVEQKQVKKPKEEPRKLEEEKKPPPEPEKKETKKEEPKQEEKKREEVKKKDAVVLDTEKEEKKIKKKPEPTKKPEIKKVKKKKEQKRDFERERSTVLQNLEKTIKDDERRDIIEELKQKQDSKEDKVIAKAETSEKAVATIKTGKSSARSATGSTSGIVTNLFLERIRNEIRRNYRIPPNIPTDGKLEAFIFFKINESGRVYDVRVDESSGNPAFDDFCVKAINKSAPLTPPPPELIDQAKTVGFLIPFTNDPS